jgi:hypothetical protein
MKEIFRKSIASGMLAVMFVTSAVGLLVIPKNALATAPVAVTASAPDAAKWLLDALKVIGENALLASITTALINTVTYAADRLAYDAAVFIASGGDGDDPLFENRTVGEYFSDYGASVAADALGQIDDSGILGNFSLCEPTLPEVTLAFKFGLQGAFQRPEPACDYKEVGENWTGFYTNIISSNYSPFEKNSQILTALADAYNPKENDFSVGIMLYTDVLSQAQQDASLSAQRQLFGGFFKDKTDFLTGRVETPAEVLQDNFRTSLEATDETKRQVALQSLGDSNVLFQIGIHAGSVFTNTLLSKFTEKLYSGLFGGLDQTNINPFDVSSLASGNGADAREMYRSFLTATVFSVENYSVLDDFGACPYAGKGLYNCVADASLISAVARADGGTAVTIAEALEQGLLNSSWPLIPSSDTARNQDIYCYTYGYCHGNLVKLRKARIISTGWELAAESAANSDSSPVTLGEVVDGFYDCNKQNELDDNHPWCHLIDPNWVLKYPETQCKNQAYGQLLESSVSDQRKTECVDMPSCIDEDGNGNCTGGYGYCVREENVWNFRGEECPEYYGSCTTYENPSGDEVNFLSNTTDASVCTADSAGCLWYNTQKDSADGATYDWPDYTLAADLTAAEAEEDIYRNRMYFTASVEDCTADDAGCRELVSRKNGTTLNMITNPSFEQDEDDNGVPDGWFVAGTGETYSEDASSMLNGTDAVNPGSSGIYYQRGIVLTQGAEYTFSFYAAQSTGTATAGGLLALEASNGESVDFRGYGLNGDCAVDSSNYNILNVTGTPSDTDYERFSCTFTVPTLADSSAEVTAFVDVLFADLWFDSVQLEQEASASDYHEGYSDAVLDLAYVKVPPTYLGCTGTDEDPEECDNYAGMCTGIDVGCSNYTPTNGDPTVTGIANELDACPAECVGYDTFKQEPTRYEPDGNFPVYFIPDSAQTCTAQYVGCDEFTDITTEEASYFTYVRACVTSDQANANAATSDADAIFYTWEGSDTDGYQLKTWNLLESDMSTTTGYMTYATSGGTDDAPGLAPCTSWTATDEGITCNDDSDGDDVIDTDTETCDEHDDTITNPDCREFYDTEGTIHYREWTDTVTVNDDCVTYRKTNIVGADTATQALNCSESGGYFNSGTAECRYYGYAEESYECPAAQSGCREYTGGRSRNSRQAFVEYFEESTLSNWEAGSASDVTLSNESIATDGHSLLSDGEPVWTYVGGDGTACATDGGCETTVGTLGGTCMLAEGETYCGTLSDDVFTGKTYVVSFWAKGEGTLSVGFDTSRTSGTAAIDAGFATGTDAITLNSDWQQYSYGPKNMEESEYPDFGDGATALVFTPGSGTTFYIDNVVLREGEDNIDVIQNSWVTPSSCDETEEGAASDQYMLGCQEYTDQNGDTVNLKSFSELCDEDKIGCEAYFMTQESDSVGGSVYGALCSTLDGAAVTEATSCYYSQNDAGTDYDTESEYLCTIGVATSTCEFNLDWYVPADDLESHLSYVASTVVSPADSDIFLVVNNNVECSSDVAGCTEVGLPVFSQDHTAVESWETAYLMNAPADYSSTLCSQDELFCQEWTDGEGSISYFKDPQNQTCEYRSDVTVGNTTYNGWFKTDTDELCDPEYVIGGDQGGIWRNGDDAYANWVGECIAKYDTCSEFQDVSDLATDDLYGDADGTSYYYMNNDALEENSLPDSQKCNGEVSQTDGCGIFNDTSDPQKTASATATYMASTHADELFGAQQNDLVDPIDCETDSTIITPDGDSVDLCANRCWYDADDFYDINGSSEQYVFDGSCYDNTDCRPLTSETGAEVNGFCASSYGNVDAPRLENESNIVLKVNRDRECSEWLSCSDTQTTWDERTNSYVTICGEIGLCTQYSGTSNASFCSAWKDNGAAVVLDVEEYASRDISWYGDDYSGYAIPGMLPVDQLTQVNIQLPYTCVTDDEADGVYGDPCVDDEVCGGTAGENELCTGSAAGSDHRLAYVAGSCEDSEFGASCSVGYCENTGSSCVDSDSCGVDGGACLIGTFYAVSADLCASSADCSTGESCLGGYCATDEGEVAIEDCVAGECLPEGISFYPSVNYKTGTCMYDQCILAPNGSMFDDNGSAAKECRAYPEINSPFGNQVVKTWEDLSAGTTPATGEETTHNLDATPREFVQNFENVQTCPLGEECECSYKKVTYGSVQRYFAPDTEFPTNSTVGLCSGGTWDGVFCSELTIYDGKGEDPGDDPYEGAVVMDTTCEDEGGSCVYPDQVDDALGLDGYCLERDSATNIYGDRDLNACLTWLPIDQLSGSTDMYAKYTEAGFFEQTEYCASVNVYADVRTTTASHGAAFKFENSSDSAEILCGEANGLRDDDPYCSGAIKCAPGTYAVIGPRYDPDDTEYTAADDHYSRTCNVGLEWDCPYVCVPIGAKIDGTGDACDVDGDPERLGESNPSSIGSYTDTFGGGDWTTEIWRIADPHDFTDWADAAQECWRFGRKMNDGSEILPVNYDVYKWDSAFPDQEVAYGLQSNVTNVYIGCSETAVVVPEGGNGAAPFTDRILNVTNYEGTNGPYSLNVGSAYPQFKYLPDSARTPFGKTINTEGVAAAPVVAACYEATDSGDYKQYEFFAPDLDLTCSTGEADDNNHDITFSNPESRALTDFHISLYRYEDGDTLSAGSGRAGGETSFSGQEFYQVSEDAQGDPGDADDGVGWVYSVNQLFAFSGGGRTYDDGVYDDGDAVWRNESDVTQGSFIEGTAGILEWDDRDTRGNAPSVWAVNTDRCYDENCEEDPDHPLTLNDQNEGNIESDMFYRAYLKFYAAADKNQLPIRRVMVDWGDGSVPTGSTSDNNFYKNHRGLEEGTETSICEKPTSDSDYAWGMNSDSCDENYFSYNHIYTCNPSRMTATCADSDGDGIYDNTPCTETGNECVYRPRVHIRDNWGLCTGTCTVGGDSADKCVDNDGDISSMTNDITDRPTWDECNYRDYPSSSYPTNDPWTYYDGIITVTP